MTTKPAAEPTTATPAEPATEPIEPSVPVTEPAPEPVKDAEFWTGKARAMEADAKKAAKRLAELESAEQARREAEMSELEKAQKRAELAENKARAAELAILRRDVASRTGLPLALVDRLRGETPEDLEADAKELLASIPAQPAPKLAPTNPGAPQTGETDAERRKRLGL